MSHPEFTPEESATEWGFVLGGPLNPTAGTSLFPEYPGRDLEVGVDAHGPFDNIQPFEDEERTKEGETWDPEILEGTYLYDSDLDHKNEGSPTKARYVTSIPYLISTYRKMEAERPGYTLWPAADYHHIWQDDDNYWEPNRVERVIEYERLPSQSKGPIKCDLGKLSGVPQEVLELILDNCTIKSLLRFRAVNRLAELTVHSLPVWKTLSYRLPFLLTTLRSPTTPIARYITAGDLLRKLVQVKCDQCGSPGDRMNLLSLERFCRFCEGDHRFQIFRASDAMQAWGLPESEETAIRELPYVANEMTKTRENAFHQRMRLMFGGRESEEILRAGVHHWGFGRLVAGSHVHEVALRYYGEDAIAKIKEVWRAESGVKPSRHVWHPYVLRQTLLPPRWMTYWPKNIQAEVINRLRPRVPWLLGNIRAVAPGAPRLDWGFRCFACEMLIQHVLSIRTLDSMERESYFADPLFAFLWPTDPWHYRLHTDETFKAHIKSWRGYNAVNTAGFHKHHRFFEEEARPVEQKWNMSQDGGAKHRRERKKTQKSVTAKFYDPDTWHLDKSTWKGFRPFIRALRTD